MTEGVSEGRIPGGGELRSWNGWADFQQRDQRQQQIDDTIAQLGHANHARTLLGWVEQTYTNGANVFMRWERRGAEQVAGLPPATVDAARRAAIAEEQARIAAEQAADTARAWLARNQPADGRMHPTHAAEHAEATTRHREAEQIALRALAALGRVAEALASIRAELAAIPAAIRANEAERALRRQGLETREKDLRAQLATFGMIE